MSQITQEQLNIFKGQFPFDGQIQALTLDVVLEHTKGKIVNFENMHSISSDQLLKAPALSASLTDCQMNIGFVVFDVVCLAVGAVGLRSTVRAQTIAAMAQAVVPVMSKIEITIARMAAQGASRTTVAWGVFEILKTIFTGGCLGAVVSAFVGSLSWWDMLLYGVTAMATIVAALATDGAALVAEIVILLATFGFLVSDSVKAVTSCSLPPAPTRYSNGTRVRDASTGKIYLVMDDALNHIPDPATFDSLFNNWDVTNAANIEGQPVHAPLTVGASLANGTPDGKVYLLTGGAKRWIIGPPVFNAYNFSWGKIKNLSAADLNKFPNGADVK